MNVKKRSASLDIISGVLILWMIVYHSFQWAELDKTPLFNTLLSFFYFFMAWFYFKAGYLFNSSRGLNEIVSSGMIKLLIPMIVWLTIGYIILIPYLFFVEKSPIWKIVIWPAYSLISSGDTIGNSPLWFLLSLFIVRVLLFFITKLSFILILIITFILLLIGWFEFYNSINLPFGLVSTPIGLLFSLSGFLIKSKFKIDKKNNFSIVVCLFVLLFTSYFNSYVDIHTNTLWFGSYFLYIATSILLITFLVPVVSFELKPISWFGVNSMIFLVIHWPIFTLVKYIWIYLGLELGYGYVITLASTSIVLGVCLGLKLSDKELLLDGKVIYDLLVLKIKQVTSNN